MKKEHVLNVIKQYFEERKNLKSWRRYRLEYIQGLISIQMNM